MKLRNNYTPAIGWGLFIFLLSVIPGKDIPKIESPWDLIKMDKFVHMTLYGILVWQILRGYRNEVQKKFNATDVKHFLVIGSIVVLGACAYGFTLEVIQENFCKDRGFEWYDGIANTIGAFVSSVFFYFLHRKRQAINR
jgi:VanZ family protein